MAADDFEGVLAGPEADAFAVSRKLKLFDLGAVSVGKSDIDETDGFVGVGAWRAGAGACDAGDGNAERGSGTAAYAFR